MLSRSPQVQFYLKPKHERLLILWKKDIGKLYKDKNSRKIFESLARVDVHFTDPQVADEFSEFKAPFKTSDSSGYILKLNITRWIHKNRYGFVIDHEIFDQSDDKVYEFGRTYHVGFIF